MAVSSLINELNSGGYNLKIGGFNVNLPSLNVSNSSIETPGIGGYLGSAGSIVQTLTSGARGVFCIGAVLTDPAAALKVLILCVDFIGAIGLQLINDLYKTCLARLNNILSTVYGITLGYFNTIKNIIKAIQGIGDLISKLIDFWNGRGESKLNKLFDRENCDFMVANLLRCMMAKMIEPYLTKIRDDLTQKINDVGIGLQNEIIENTAVATSMSKYFDQQAIFVNKFTTQVSEIL